MLDYFKKLISKKIKIIKNNEDLLVRLEEIKYKKNLDEIVFSSIGKLAIINVYTESYHQLLANIVNVNYRNSFIAINLDKYFKDFNGSTSLEIFIDRVIKLVISNRDLNIFIKQDIEEIIRTINYLYLLGDNNGS